MLLKITYTVQEDPDIPCKITATCPVLGQSDDQYEKCWWVLIEGEACPLILAASDPTRFLLEIRGRVKTTASLCCPVESVEVVQDFVSPLACILAASNPPNIAQRMPALDMGNSQSSPQSQLFTWEH